MTKQLVEESKQKRHDNIVEKMIAEGKAKQVQNLEKTTPISLSDAFTSNTAFAGQLGSLTANLATSLGTIDKQLKPYIGTGKPLPATTVPAKQVSTNVGESLGGISQLLTATINPKKLSTDDVVTKTLQQVAATNQRMDEIHAHPLGFGFLDSNEHKDLYNSIAGATDLPKDVTDANAKPQVVDETSTLAMALGKSMAAASVEHPLAGALTLNADALVNQINEYESGNDALYKFEEERLNKLVDAEQKKEEDAFQLQ
jgi:hypothetical protein